MQYLFGLGSQGEVQAIGRHRVDIITSQLDILFCYAMDFKTHYLPDMQLCKIFLDSHVLAPTPYSYSKWSVLLA